MATTLEAGLLERLRLGSGELWRGMRARVGIRVLAWVLVVHAAFYMVLWLLGEAWPAIPCRALAVGIAMFLLPVVGVSAGCGMAFLDSLGALVVSGPLLRALGDRVLSARLQPGASDLAGQFAPWTSSGGLARLVRIRDLPLLVFLARTILGVDVKALLEASRNRADPEELVREMERRARVRAAGTLRVLKVVLYLLAGAAVCCPVIVGSLCG